MSTTKIPTVKADNEPKFHFKTGLKGLFLLLLKPRQTLKCGIINVWE